MGGGLENRCVGRVYGADGIRFSAPSFWMGGGLENRYVGCVYGADGATVNTTYGAALKTTTHPKIRCRKPYAATQHLMLLMMGVYGV